MPIRPMKGVLVTDKNRNMIKFPVCGSFKIDGIRGIVCDKASYSTSGARLKSLYLQELSSRMPDGLDGEWGYGLPSDPEFYSKTFSAVMSREWPSDLSKDKLKFYAFEDAGFGKDFARNHEALILKTSPIDHPWIEVLDQYVLSSLEELDVYYKLACDSGYEGLVLRHPASTYKQGRSTELQGAFWKLKPFGTELSEAIILDWYPLQTNLNEASRNAFGLTERSSHSFNKVDTELLGGFLVKDLKTGQEFKIGGGKGMTYKLRSDLFKVGDNLKGKVVRYTQMAYGGKDAPRHPQYRGFRDPIDMTEY